MAAATTTSSNCTIFFQGRGDDHVDPMTVRSPSSQGHGHGHGHGHGCAKLDGVAMWLMNGVANAFFASLQRCSCIRIATVDDHEEDSLILKDGDLGYDGTRTVAGSSRWRKRSKGKKGITTAFVEL